MKIKVVTPMFGGRLSKSGEPFTRCWSVRVERWSLWRYLLYRSYHWYDMRVVKVLKFFRLYDRLYAIRWPRAKDEWEPDGWFQQWMVAQDYRCFYLSSKGETLLVRDVTEEEYETLRR